MKTARSIFVMLAILSVGILIGCASLSPDSIANPISSQPVTPVATTVPDQRPTPQPKVVQGTLPAPDQKPPQQLGNNPRSPSTAQSSQAGTMQQVGLILNTAQAFTGYTLFAPKHYTTTYLIDMNGNVVNSWKSKYEPGQSVYLLSNGNLLHSNFAKNRDLPVGGGEGGGMEELDWNGNVVWEFWYMSDKYQTHHDIKPMPNGNVLALAVEKKTREECIAAGFNPQLLQDNLLLPDSVIEIQKTGPKTGKVVWEWHVWDHLVQDFDKSKANYGDVAAHPELIDANGAGRHLPAFWNHMNSIDYNATLDQVMVSVRGNSETWIIDHSTTTKEAASHTGGRSGKGGDLLFRWGNPQMYRAGKVSDQLLLEQHDAEWIPAGYPGAGNILVFNNGLGRNYSTVEEFTPPVDASGRYALTAGTAFGPKGFVWSYKANPPSSFFSDAISGAQRLPNGNTLIDDGVHGIFFEVTSSGETVWKYVNPVVQTGPLTQGNAIPPDPARAGEQMNAVFRVLRYAPNYPGLVGKTLTPLGKIEK